MASKEPTLEQMRADIAASRHAMTVGLEGLVTEVHPTAIKNRFIDEVKKTISDTKQMVVDAAEDAVGYFVDEDGVRWDNVGTAAMVVGAGVAVVAAFGGVGALIRRIGK